MSASDQPCEPSPSPPQTLLVVACVCGALPLIAGVSTFALWLFTRWPAFQLVGAIVLTGVGPLLFGIGMLALAWHAVRVLGARGRRVWLATVACGLLLLANFPAAAAIILTVVHIETRYVVVLHNASDQPLTDVRVFGGGVDETFPAIAPGESVSRSIWFSSDGSLELTGTLGDQPIAANLEGYVTSGQGGSARVTINNTNAIRVTHPGTAYY